ncbi:uncharacterized protein B0J16DRAFT_304200 [Fusarium flagelliforme]|uniref:uncharacterized protein n=1 Tax=Fusarium flagelliforme TaxID=2675880 RepID=UPI001E8E975B|nr:uncharacterized protein B0J16DRAFT_304200 [Fusarium flagelliforme]KAH7184948.1 hypothetical protein B0J16DRAFT_304200 [Fusarium flagelliforme]
MSKDRSSPMPLLKTCQTCFHLKIRCEKTQDSDLCDRCLRLGKTCVFNQARRRQNVNRQRERLGAKSASRSPGNPQARTVEGNHDILNKDVSLDPFEQGFLDFETGRQLLHIFRSRLIPYFPFVLFPIESSIEELNQEHPCACLAMLVAASYSDVTLQVALGNLFKQIVAVRMVEGDFNQLDLLQGLLIHVACIISDLRLDRPRKPKLWSAEGGRYQNQPEWQPDEMRALAGAYYLSSSSSIILQKSRQVFNTTYLSACCEHLASLNQYPTDRFLPYIIQTQTLIENIEDLVCKTAPTDNGLQFFTECQEITQKCGMIKTTLPFPLSESPPLLLQIHILELMLSQSSPRGTAFGLDKFQNPFEDETTLNEWLSTSMSATRSLIGVILVMPQGEEVAMSNMGWIMMNCALNLAVRLDLIAARGSLSGFTQHLRRFLDMKHTLRQLVLRFQGVPGPDAPPDHPFHSIVKRIRRLENWYLSQIAQQTAASTSSISPSSGPQPSISISDHSGGMPVGVPLPYQNTGSWNMGGSEWYQNPDLDISTFLFADPIDFPIHFGWGS